MVDSQSCCRVAGLLGGKSDDQPRGVSVVRNATGDRLTSVAEDHPATVVSIDARISLYPGTPVYVQYGNHELRYDETGGDGGDD